MTTKVAILSTIGIVIAELVIGLLVLFLFVDLQAPGANRRAEALGQGMAMLAVIPIGAVWVMWAVRVRKDRERKQRSQAKRN